MKRYSIAIFAIVLAGLSSCVNDLNVQTIDPNSSSSIDARSLFVKIYSTLALTGQQGPSGNGDVAGVDEGTSSFYRMTYSLQEFPADQIYWIWPDVGVDDIRKMSWTASNSLIKGLYARLYFDITLCNLYLDQYATGATKEEIAEVRFIRALNYWYLLDMFGNVPMVEHLDLGTLPDQIERPDLYSWLKKELEENIAPNLSSAGQRPSYYRVDQSAAWMLLSRLCLNAEIYGKDRNGVQRITDLEKEYTDAAFYANEVLTKGGYELASEYRYLFMGDNDNLAGINDAYKEIILPIAQDGIETQSYGASLFLIASCYTSGMPAYGITENWKCIRSRAQLVQLFCPKFSSPIAKEITTEEAAKKAYGDYCGNADTIAKAANDARARFCNYSTDGANTYACQFWFENTKDKFLSGWGIQKFSNLMADTTRAAHDTKYPDMDVPLMRLGEAYLNYAEAVLRGGTQCGMSVDEAVNTVRRRAGAEEKTGWNLTDAPLKGLNIIDERGRELYSEGLRRSDLIRFGLFTGKAYRWEYKAGELLGINASPEDFRALYPLPLSEITANSKLKQNPGY